MLVAPQKPIEGELPGSIFGGENGKIFETFWRASTHYLINAWLEKGGMVT